LLKAKFHYASLFGAGWEPAPNRFGAGTELPVRSRYGVSSELVRSWLRSSEPASVMEFGYKQTYGFFLPLYWRACSVHRTPLQPRRHVAYPATWHFDVEERTSLPCQVSTWSGVQRRSREI